jgi:hypothetical protein
MYRTRLYLWTSIVLAVGGVMIAGAAFAQQNRIREYENKLEKEIAGELEEFRANGLEQRRETLASMTAESAPVRPRTLPEPQPDPEMAQERREELEESIEGLERPFKSVVNVYESNDGDGQDVEIRMTMPIDAFMEFAPIAALEAAAIPHKFSVVYIYLREETTDRVARVAFRDAEPIAGRYLAGDVDAVSDMKQAIIWH